MCNLSQGIKEASYNTGYKNAYSEATEKGIINLIQTVAKYGGSKEDSINDIQEKYSLLRSEATSLVEKHYPQS